MIKNKKNKHPRKSNIDRHPQIQLWKYNEVDTPLFMSAVYKCYINE